MAKQYQCLPSEIMHIEDPYTAYCFDEACSYILLKLSNGEKPVYKVQDEQAEMETKHYKNFKDFYKDIK